MKLGFKTETLSPCTSEKIDHNFLNLLKVIKLENEWGEHLVSLKQMDAAINHFIEAGNSAKLC